MKNKSKCKKDGNCRASDLKKCNPFRKTKISKGTNIGVDEWQTEVPSPNPMNSNNSLSPSHWECTELCFKYLLITRRLNRSIITAVVLGVAGSASYSCLPRLSFEEAPYQAAWVAAGIAFGSALIQSIVENLDEVLRSRAMINREKHQNQNTLGIGWIDQLLHAMQIAIVLASRYWAATILGPIK